MRKIPFVWIITSNGKKRKMSTSKSFPIEKNFGYDLTATNAYGAIINDGIRAIKCYSNPNLEEINLPDSVDYIMCDATLRIYSTRKDLKIFYVL